MSTGVSSPLEISPEQREMSLPMADMITRQAPDPASEHRSYVYLLGDGIHVSVEKPHDDGTIPIVIADDKKHGEGNWTPGSVNGANFRVKRAFWSDEDGILVPTGVLEPIIDAMEATEARRCSSNMRQDLEAKRKSIGMTPPEGVDINKIRQLHNSLFWAAWQGVDLT